jgi:hypothetical protein
VVSVLASIASAPRTHQLRSKLGLALVSTLLCLVGLEAALRALAWQEDRKILDQALLVDSLPPPGANVELRDMIRLSVHERIIYELKPDLPGVLFQGTQVFTNHRGFLGPEVQVPKPEGVVRVVGLGDSVMFGWRMPRGKEYLAVLDRQLAQRRPDQDWEFVNTAVPGYNTAMEVATLQHKALDLVPDLVIVGLTFNDLDLPNFIRERRAYLAWDRSFLVDFVYGRFEGRSRRDGLQPAPQEEGDLNFLGDPRLVPAEYRDMVGIQGFEAALNQLAELARRHDFGVIFVTMFGSLDVRPLMERAREQGFETIAVIADVRAYKKSHPGESFLDLGLYVDADDDHPSAMAHEMIARSLLTVLEEPDALGRLKAQVRAASPD